MSKRSGNPKSQRRVLPGDPDDGEMLKRILRVDHAGEFGAVRIYSGQADVIGQDSKEGQAIRHMAAQEAEHLASFSQLLSERGVNATALMPLWNALGYMLGWGTAAMGKKAAMACTMAVEEVIDGHYLRQMEILSQMNEPDLLRLITRFRDDEIAHMKTAELHGAEGENLYPLLRKLIRAGSRTAIWLSERF